MGYIRQAFKTWEIKVEILFQNMDLPWLFRWVTVAPTFVVPVSLAATGKPKLAMCPTFPVWYCRQPEGPAPIDVSISSHCSKKKDHLPKPPPLKPPLPQSLNQLNNI